MGAYKVSRVLNRDVAAICDIRNKEVASPACLHRKSRVLCPSVSDASNCSSRILLHRSWAPAKKVIPRDKREAVKRSKNASQARQCSSLGDWNAGKEDESLPGPNFDVPRDLFIGKMSSKKRAKWYIRYVIISHDAVNIGTDGTLATVGRTMAAQEY